MIIPSSTYRIQLNSSFTFDDTAKYVDYFSQLGISHLYLSPCLQARPGSSHGYDVVDYSEINEELGGEKGLEWLDRKLKEKNMGQVHDIVPNHMAISGAENRWWWDVLENGPFSLYSSYFDVDWEFPPELPSNKILLPILGDHYGKVVEAKEIFIRRREHEFTIRYYDHIFPASPKSLIDILSTPSNKTKSDELSFIISALHHLPPPTMIDRVRMKSRNRDKRVIFMFLSRLLEEQPHIRKMVDEEIELINTHPDRLDLFLEKQNYRLAFWRTARTDLGYRRFFNINSYVALCMEDPDVFSDTHEFILSLVEKQIIQGLRIDHIDGLLDPEVYLRRLKEKAGDTWIVVEKILHQDEQLRQAWPVAGTTGYDFLNEASGIFINQDSEEVFSRLYTDFTSEHRDYKTVLYENKKKIMKILLASDINRLVTNFLKICQNNRRYRDYSKDELIEALEEYIAQLDVYRTYIRIEKCPASGEDKEIINGAIEKAKKNKKNIDPDLFDFLKNLITCRNDKEEETEFARQLQQLTGPVMAKGAEDTTFYCYNKFIMLNEVGGDPSAFGLDVESYHQKQRARSEKHPFSMLATSTHDTKRSEDVRARLAVLTEIPEVWKEFVEKSSKNNEKYKKNGMPDKNMEYHLYQIIIGIWPVNDIRLIEYAAKAAREAKTFTSWIKQNNQYEESLFDFIRSVLSDEAFKKNVETLLSQILSPGRINSLAMVLLKLTAPGVPDIYQGTELWDLSLVDPDNRRPVDYEQRQRLLHEMMSTNVKDIMNRMDDGLPKMWLIRKVLSLRSTHLELFHNQPYHNITPEGSMSRHVIAFMRGEHLVTVVPRLTKHLRGWEDTIIRVPAGKWSGVLDEKEYEGDCIALGELFDTFPVALLVRKENKPE